MYLSWWALMLANLSSKLFRNKKNLEFLKYKYKSVIDRGVHMDTETFQFHINAVVWLFFAALYQIRSV